MIWLNSNIYYLKGKIENGNINPILDLKWYFYV